MSNDSFGGSIPNFYERYMVPMVFGPYAMDMVARVIESNPTSVLETAAGTGIVTRRLADAASGPTTITATDISQGMLDLASTFATDRPIIWKQADAAALPFDESSFDVLFSQFGVMFFKDKRLAFREAKRVLKPGGRFIFSVWDRVESNDFANTVNATVKKVFPKDPPSFLETTPHGYYDAKIIGADLESAGFDRTSSFTIVHAVSKADSADIAATALCEGTPLRAEIEARAPQGLPGVTELARQAMVERFGTGPISGNLRALLIEVSA